MSLLCLLLLLFVGTALGETIRLSSSKIALVIDAESGSLKEIHNRITGQRTTLRERAFVLTTTRGEVSPYECKVRRLRADQSSAAFRFSGEGMDVELEYRIVSPDGAVRKLLRVTNRQEAPLTLLRVTTFEWTLPGEWPKGYPHSYHPSGINQVHLHRSGIWYNQPINLFLRDEAGGLFLGVENPYFEANYWSLRKVYPTRVEVSYPPRWILNRGETFEGDPGFVGAYRQEGIYSVPPQRVYFSGRQRMAFELLDWGEVWAMQDYMRSIMTLPRASETGYYMSYWGRVDPGLLGKLSRSKERGDRLTSEQEAMLRHFGGGPFAFREQELWYRLTPETVRLYRRMADDAHALGHFQTLTIPNMMAGQSGWFVSPEQKQDSSVEKRTDTWFQQPAFPLWKEVADYAAAKGLGMFTLELAGREYRRDRPDWKYQDADGRRSKSNCYANRAYAEWYTSQVDRALSTHPIRHWQWDEGWLDVLRGMIGEEAHCYATGHGHPPGNVSYHVFRNVASTLETLKQRHPQVRLVIISGLIRGMPWIMKNLDADSHTGAMDDAAWMDNNRYFLPPSRSHRRDGLHWILDNFSAGVEPQESAGWFSMLEDPAQFQAYRRKWSRWAAWASEHQGHLERRRDLFHRAGEDGLQGTAHALGNQGFLFLHNAGSQGKAAELTWDARLGLERSDRLSIRQIYPEDRSYGVYAWADTVRIAVSAGATLAIEVAAAEDAIDRRIPPPPAGAEVQRAFLFLTDAAKLLDSSDLWPSLPLPGRDNMPRF